MNTPAMLLDAFSRGKGVLSYNEFVTNVIGLQPDALREVPGSTTPLTHEIMQSASDGLKSSFFKSKMNRDRVFEIFDKDGGGSISLREFSDGISRMGLPVNKTQVEQLFQQFDQGKSGQLNMVKFTKDLMGMGSQKTSRSRMPTSRGGAPKMPKEFMDAPRPKTMQSRPRTSMENDQNSLNMMELGNTMRSLTPQPSRLMPQQPNHLSQSPKKRRSPRKLDKLMAATSRSGMSLLSQTMGSEAWSSPVPTHRIKNVVQGRPGIGGNYVGNFFVADGSYEANFSPQQVGTIARQAGLTPLGSARSSVRGARESKKVRSNMFSDQAALPHFVQTATLGRADPHHD